MSRASICLLIVASWAMTSCTAFENMLTKPKPEAPTAVEKTYLQGGPNTDIELGQDERTLLEDYKKLNDTRIALETQLSEMRTENEQIRAQLNRAETERDQLRNHLAGANQEGERMSQRVRDLEAKVLSLNIEKTLLEQEILRARISSLREQYEDITNVPAAMPGVEGAAR